MTMLLQRALDRLRELDRATWETVRALALYDQAALDAEVAAERERWTAVAARLLDALDALDRGEETPGFRGLQNALGEDVGDEVQDAREAMAHRLGRTMP